MKRDDLRYGMKTPARTAVWLLAMAIAVSLCLSCRRGPSSSDRSSLDGYAQSGRRIDAAAKSIELVLAAAPAALATSTLSSPPSAPAHHADEEEPTVDFQLKGIIGTEHAPMIVTSVGVVGLGEEVQGFKVVKIEDDAVTVVDKRGRQMTIHLYKEESRP